MTLNQRGELATGLDPILGLCDIKTDDMLGVGLYGGVVRDPRDPSKKTGSGEGFNSIKLPFCALSVSYCTLPEAPTERFPYCL